MRGFLGFAFGLAVWTVEKFFEMSAAANVGRLLVDVGVDVPRFKSGSAAWLYAVAGWQAARLDSTSLYDGKPGWQLELSLAFTRFTLTWQPHDPE